MGTDVKTSNGPFPTTQWSLVRVAGNGSGAIGRDALARLLEQYAPALRAHLVRGRGVTPDDAEDLVQSFIADKVLGRDFIRLAQPSRGRFRTFLAVSLDRYAISCGRSERARKRSSHLRVELDERCQSLADRSPGPERALDVSWARQVLRQAIDAMRAGCHAAARPDIWGVFEGRVLCPLLYGDAPVPYGELVGRYGFVSPSQASNVLVTANRMFARALRDVVGAYTAGPDDVEEEIADLRRILAGGG
jgi:RNA polymerase sigma-70 factor (ECF subfamily)